MVAEDITEPAKNTAGRVPDGSDTGGHRAPNPPEEFRCGAIQAVAVGRVPFTPAPSGSALRDAPQPVVDALDEASQTAKGRGRRGRGRWCNVGHKRGSSLDK